MMTDGKVRSPRSLAVSIRHLALAAVGLFVLVSPAAAQLANATVVVGEDNVFVTTTSEDEYIFAGTDVFGPGSIGVDEDGNPIPDEAVVILQLFVQLQGGQPLPVFGAGVNILTEDGLGLITLEDDPSISIDAAGGDDWVDMSTIFLEESDPSFILIGNTGDDALIGNIGEDILLGGPGNDYLFGGDGDDQGEDDQVGLDGGPGDDILDGGAGDDSIDGSIGNDVLRSNCGDDTLISGPGYDVLDYSWVSVAITADLLGESVEKNSGPFCTGEDEITLDFEVFVGADGSGGDTIIGFTDRPNLILAGTGNDTVTGGPEPDILFGDAGNDNIQAGGDQDTIVGGSGEDSLYGDTRDGSDDESDTIFGDGFDWVRFNLNGQPLQNSKPFIREVPHPLTGLTGVGGVNILSDAPLVPGGGAGPGVLNIAQLIGQQGGYGSNPSAYLNDDYLLPARDGLPNSDGEVDVSGANDTIAGGNGNDNIAGGDGDDTIYGGNQPPDEEDAPFEGVGDDGDDIIFGDRVMGRGAVGVSGTALGNFGSFGPWLPSAADIAQDGGRFGNDDIHAYFGADVVLGGGGGDQINGGAGSDTIYGDYYFRPRNASDEAAGIDPYDTIVANVQGSNYSDSIYGDGILFNGDNPHGRDEIFGGPGNDTLMGGPGNDAIQGNSGFDCIAGGELLANSGGYDDGFLGTCVPDIDSDPGDTLDYSLVPASVPPIPQIQVTGTGVNVQLGSAAGDNVGEPGSASGGPTGLNNDAIGDGEGSSDTLYGMDNVVGSVNNDVIIGHDRDDKGRYGNDGIIDAFNIFRFPVSPQTPDRADFTVFTYVRGLFFSTIIGSGYDNILVGLEGNDLIIGRRGQDACAGNEGDDVIWGDNRTSGTNGDGTGVVSQFDDPENEGHDELWGDDGNDEVHGEYGHDIIRGGNGEDFLSGGWGEDILDYTEQGPVVVNLRDSSIDLNDVSNMAQRFNLPFDPAGILDGLPGGTLRYPDFLNDGRDGVQVGGGSVQPAETVTDGGFPRSLDTIGANRSIRFGDIEGRDQFEIIRGSPSSDVIFGSRILPTLLRGLAGNDFLFGGEKDDVIEGGTGNDVIEGRDGDDQLIGGASPETPPGPQLNVDEDYASYDHVTVPFEDGLGTTGAVVNLGESEPQDTLVAGIDRLIEIENLIGSQFNDILKGNQKKNIIYGGLGNDWLTGRSDEEILQHNLIFYTTDVLHGGDEITPAGQTGTDVADYRLSDPEIIAASLDEILAVSPTCFADPAVDCDVPEDGEGGTDVLVQIEDLREPPTDLVVNLSAIGSDNPNNIILINEDGSATIAPGGSVPLLASASGGTPPYLAEYDPTEADIENPEGDNLPPVPVSLISPIRVTDLEAGETFTSVATPLETTTYRVTFTDSQDPFQLGIRPTDDPPPAKTAVAFLRVQVAEELVVAVDRDEYTIGTVGETVQLQGRVTGGLPPFDVQWTASDDSELETLSSPTILIPIASPTVTTEYTLTVTDAVGQVGTVNTVVRVAGTGGAVAPDNAASAGDQEEAGDSESPNTTSQELSSETDGGSVPPPPMCGAGVVSSLLFGNLLLWVGRRRSRRVII